MPGNINVQEVRDNVSAILKVWTANPDFKLKDVTMEALQEDAAAFEAALTALQQKEDEMAPPRNPLSLHLLDKGQSIPLRTLSGLNAYV